MQIDARVDSRSSWEKQLIIYRNLGAVSDGQSGMRIDLPIIGKSIDTPK